MNSVLLQGAVRTTRVGVFAAMLAASAPALGSPVLDQEDAILTAPMCNTTSIHQNIKFERTMRAVNLDGTPRASVPLGMFVYPNSFEPSTCSDSIIYMSVNAFTGSYAPTEVDIQLPTRGPVWTIGRTYNAVQPGHDSNGFQGFNWYQSSQPALFVGTSSPCTITKTTSRGAEDRDVLVLALGADRFIEFVQEGPRGETGQDSFLYKAKNGAAGVIYQWINSNNEYYRYTDVHGTHLTFVRDVSNPSTPGPMYFWMVEDAAGQKSYMGSSTTSLSGGYDSDGDPILAYDASGRKYVYTYSSAAIGGVKRLLQVQVQESGTSSTLVQQVDYDYYGSGASSDANGSSGDLRLVTLTTPLSDGSTTLVQSKYYRYYTGTYNSSSNPGYPHQVKLALGFEGVRQFGLSGLAGANDSALKPYAEAYFTYESASTRRVATAFFSGRCGCSGGGGGGSSVLNTFAYYDVSGKATMLGNGVYDASVASWTQITRPDSAAETLLFDETGQSLGRVLEKGSEPLIASRITRNSAGQVATRCSPANATAYSAGVITSSSSAGLVTVYDRYPSGVSSPSADLNGLPVAISYQEGTGSTTPTLISRMDYTSQAYEPVSGSSTTVVTPFLSGSSVYPAGTAQTTALTYAFWSSTATDPKVLRPKSITTTAPAVSSATNGSNAATSSVRYLRVDGSAAYAQDQHGTLNYTRIDDRGQTTARVMDVSSGNSLIASGDAMSTWSLATTGTREDVSTTMTYDLQGRLASVAVPALGGPRTSVLYATRLGDGRMVTLSIPRQVAASSTTSYGPVQYRVSNHAGATEWSGTIALPSTGTTAALSTWVSTSSSDALGAIDSALRGSTGDKLFGLVRTQYDKVGTQATSTRAYFGSATAESATGAYDESTFEYDVMGRLIKRVSPAGTINETLYDTRGLVIGSKIGTSTGNMVRVSAMTYDVNGALTQSIQYPSGSTITTDQRQTDYTRDYRGRVIIEQGPVLPYRLMKYDELDRVTAAALMGTAPSASDNPVATTLTGRLALSETFYDERGQVYRTTRWNIDPADGSKDASISSDRWYDAAGQLIKTAGEQLTKTQYDVLHRPVRRAVLASTDDTGYSDADKLIGDKVLEESVTVYDTLSDSGLEMMQVSVRRHPGDTTSTDSLGGVSGFTATPGSAAGRMQITSMWYDDLGRPVVTAQRGTSGGSSYSRASSGVYDSMPTASSALQLVSAVLYDDAGNAQGRVDGEGKVTWTLFDQANRRTAEVRHYTAGSLANPARSNDVYTRFTYSAGHLSEMWVDVDGDGAQDLPGSSGSMNASDQVTTYTYGVVTTSTLPSAIVSNDLLRSAIYPPQTNTQAAADRTVLYAYNALGEQTRTKDQNGTEHTITYDAGGRRQSDAATHGTGIDPLVDSVALTYTSLGQVDTITQYDGSTALDQLKYTYDGWGNVLTLTQDRNSTIGASGSIDEGTVAYSYALSTPSSPAGRHAVQRSGYTVSQPGSPTTIEQTVSYDYASGLDALSSRVTRVEVDVGGGPVQVAAYDYLGLATKVGTDLPQANMASRLYSVSGGGAVTFDALDAFDRVTKSRWLSDNGTTYYDTRPSYDDAGNITQTTEGVLKRRDVVYTIDGLDRVTKADEGTIAGGGGGAISSGTRTRVEDWSSLSQTGNWLAFTRYLDDYGVKHVDAAGEFSAANELLSRDLTPGASPSTPESVPTYDLAGHQTGDGEHFTYTYDAWGRLVRVNQRTGGAFVARYRYNGLGYRIGWRYDADESGATVENGSGADPWYWFIYNERWQMLATYRAPTWGYDSANDLDAKELLVNHAAGLDGLGGSSYIDEMILRDGDDTSRGFDEEARSDLEDRLFYLQNWRADVVVTVLPAVDSSTDPQVLDQVRYSPYGVPWAVSLADVTSVGGTATFTPDGQLTVDDVIAIAGWASSSDLNGDIASTGQSDPPATPDGATDSNDVTVFVNAYGNDVGVTGRGILSRWHSRKGYAGYEWDPGLERASRNVTVGGGDDPTIALPSRSMWHVRHRVLDAETGRWTRRDPLGYVDGMGLYVYLRARLVLLNDPFGQSPWSEPLAPLFPAKSPSISPPATPTPRSPFPWPRDFYPLAPGKWSPLGPIPWIGPGGLRLPWNPTQFPIPQDIFGPPRGPDECQLPWSPEWKRDFDPYLDLNWAEYLWWLHYGADSDPRALANLTDWEMFRKCTVTSTGIVTCAWGIIRGLLTFGIDGDLGTELPYDYPPPSDVTTGDPIRPMEFKWAPASRQDELFHWWDENGGEWHWHPADRWHPSHWDYNPWRHPTDEWIKPGFPLHILPPTY